MASRSKNIFSYLDSDDEDVPKPTSKRAEPAAAGAVALNKPAAGNKKTPKKNASATPDAPKAAGDKAEQAPREGGRGTRGRGPGGFGGRGGGRGGGRRDFDRRSGTGRGRETSKQGGGARNWGNENDKSELTAEADAQEGKSKETGEEDEAPAAAADAEDAAPVEEEPQVELLTLDEYLAKKKEARTGELFADVEVRQVVDEFTNAVQITKDGKTPDYVEAQYEKVFSKKTSGRKKQVVTDLGFQSAAPERRSFRENDGGRGGRGGFGRGGSGRGGFAGGRAAGRGGRGASVPNVADMSAFPTLG